MPFRKCSQTGHNVRTCPQLINEEQTIPSNQEIADTGQSVNTGSTPVVEVDECPICMEKINDTNSCITPCNHKFCLICMLKHSQNKNDCPICRHKFNFTLSPNIPTNPLNSIRHPIIPTNPQSSIRHPIRRRFRMLIQNTTAQIIDISRISQYMPGTHLPKFRKVTNVPSGNDKLCDFASSDNVVFLFTPRDIIERYHRDIIVPNQAISFENFISNPYTWTPQDIIEQGDYYSKYVCSFCGNGNYTIHDNGVQYDSIGFSQE